MGWRDRAACAGADPAAFYPSDAGTSGHGVVVAAEKTITVWCLHCEARDGCLAAVLALHRVDRWGVQGGVYWPAHHGQPRDPRGILEAYLAGLAAVTGGDAADTVCCSNAGPGVGTPRPAADQPVQAEGGRREPSRRRP